MKDYEFFYRNSYSSLLENIKAGLKNGPVNITVDCQVKNEKDLNKKSVQHSIRRVARMAASRAFKMAKIPTMRVIVPTEDASLCGHEIKANVPIPAFFADIVDDGEVSAHMISTGIIQYLIDGGDSIIINNGDKDGENAKEAMRQNKEYYKSLLVALFPEILSEDIQVPDKPNKEKVLELLAELRAEISKKVKTVDTEVECG